MADLVVIGGGVIGCAIAMRAREFCSDLTILERRPQLGLGTSQAAVGGVHAQSDELCHGPLRVVADRSQQMYPEWIARIAAEAELPVPYLDTGLLQVALSEGEMQRLHDELVPEWRAQGFRLEELDAHELHSEEPLLGPDALGAIWLPDEGAVEPIVLMAGLSAVLKRDMGVNIKCNTQALSVITGRNGVSIELVGGEVIHADRCVVAAGVWSGEILPLDANIIFPVKGQSLEFRIPGASGYPLRHHVYSKVRLANRYQTAYLIPRSDGRVGASATYEDGLWDEEITVEGQRAVREGVTALCPAVDEWELVGQRAGVRPATPDGCPLIGEVDASKRLIAATGHYGIGITLAPVTGELVASILSGKDLVPEVAEALKICNPFRFDLRS